MEAPHLKPAHTSPALPEANHQIYERLTAPPPAAFNEHTVPRFIQGGDFGILFVVEPTPQGENLVWTGIQVPNRSSTSPSVFFTLTPFPDPTKSKPLLDALVKAHRNGTKADDLLVDLESLAREITGTGWVSSLTLPLHTRLELPPMTALPPTLEMIIKRDPLVGCQFACSLNTNGRFDICAATINEHEEKVTFDFLRSETSNPPSVFKRIDLRLPGSFRDILRTTGGSTLQQLERMASEFQGYFHRGGAEFAIARLERFMVKFNGSEHLHPDAPRDEHLRLMKDLCPPFHFSHTYPSGAHLAVESGQDVVGLTLKASQSPESSSYSVIVDRLSLHLNDQEWNARRAHFMKAAHLLASKSEAVRTQALETIEALATKRATNPAEITHILGKTGADRIMAFGQNTPLYGYVTSGASPSEVSRLCDGSEVLELSLTTKTLGTTPLALFNKLTLELRKNGDVAFTARNALGNTVTGSVTVNSGEVTAKHADISELICQYFVRQATSRDPVGFIADIESLNRFLPDIDEDMSFCISRGSESQMELPLPSDHEGIRAFHIAAELTRVACEYAGGHGIHHAGVPKNGTAEIRLQFPEAPYNLTLYVEDEMLVKASFEPTPVINGALQRVYHFSGRLNVKQCGEGQIESFIADFARWGKEHSQKKPNIEPLEETVAFSVLKKVLSDS